MFLGAVDKIRQKVAPGSVVVLQMEESPALTLLADRGEWDERRYGRNHLLIWVKDPEETPAES